MHAPKGGRRGWAPAPPRMPPTEEQHACETVCTHTIPELGRQYTWTNSSTKAPWTKAPWTPGVSQMPQLMQYLAQHWFSYQRATLGAMLKGAYQDSFSVTAYHSYHRHSLLHRLPESATSHD